LKSIKVNEGNYEDEMNISCFPKKASRATLAIDVAIPRVRIVPWQHCIKLLSTILYFLALTSQWTPFGFEMDS
jgi:hypothetical protein